MSIAITPDLASAHAAQSGRASVLPSVAHTIALWAANDLCNRIAESDRTLAEHGAALDNESLSRDRLKTSLVAIMASEDRPVIAGDVAFWLGGDGEVRFREIGPPPDAADF